MHALEPVCVSLQVMGDDRDDCVGVREVTVDREDAQVALAVPLRAVHVNEVVARHGPVVQSLAFVTMSGDVCKETGGGNELPNSKGHRNDVD